MTRGASQQEQRMLEGKEACLCVDLTARTDESSASLELRDKVIGSTTGIASKRVFAEDCAIEASSIESPADNDDYVAAEDVLIDLVAQLGWQLQERWERLPGCKWSGCGQRPAKRGQ